MAATADLETGLRDSNSQEAHVPTDLWKSIQSKLLPALADIPFAPRHTGSRWQYQTVELDFADLIVRISTGRGLFEVTFSSLADPLQFYGSEEVLSYLKSAVPTLTTTDVDITISRLRDFLPGNYETLCRLFSRHEYLQTREALIEIRRRQMDKMFPRD
jgi:hypothetical protein